MRRLLPPLLLIATIALPATATATEFRLDGYYRFQAKLFDSLSLDREDEAAEGLRTYFEHRLVLKPHLRINPNVHVFVDLDVMDALKFGTNPQILEAVGATQENGDAFDEPLALSGSVIPGSDYRESLFVRRAWAEVYTPYVDIKVGRMGSHWGMGLLANDGNCESCDWGDTVDRIQIGTSYLDPVRINVAFDTRAEGFINRNDDTSSLLASGGYLGEVHQLAAYLRWTRQPSNRFNVIHADLYGATQLGPLSMELEALLLWGRAATTDIGIDDLRVLAGGGVFRAGLEINPIAAGLEIGLATGDKDPTDNEWHTLSFDRDHNVGIVMFEESIPTFAVGEFADEENGNLDLSRAVSHEGVSNAFYLKPELHVDIRDDLRAGLGATFAFPVVPAAFGEDEPNFYGVEIDLGATYTLFEAFEVTANAGLFFPGPVYGDHRAFTFAGELIALVRF